MDCWRIILGWAAFAVFHSLTVSEGYERIARRALGERAFEAYHRLIFTAYSAPPFLLLALSLGAVPGARLYRLEGSFRILFHFVQACGAAFLLWTPWDFLEFAGIRQWERRRRGGPAAPEGGGALSSGTGARRPPVPPPPPAAESRRHPRVSNTGREKPKERGEPGWENRNLRWSSSPITSARSATSETGAWPGSRSAST